MNFNTEKPIYLQIVDAISDRILSGELKGGDRIPSVREYGADIGVNPNTMMRSYEKLTTDGIIYNKRGLGYFVTKGAKKQILKARKQEFMKERLPELFRQMQLLDISIEDIVNAWDKK